MLTLLEFALQNLLFIGLHLDSRSSFPKQLSPKEEEECIALIAQGDMDARGKLIEHNLRLVAYIVNKNYPEAVRGCQQDADDLISIGTIGLIRAAETFDYTKGRRFSTYASRCIDNQIKMHFRKIKRQQSEVYINEPLETDSEGNTLTIADILASNVNIEEETELRINSQKLYRYIDEELDEREKEIICKRYGIRDGRGFVCEAMTQREIAKQLKISRSYISRIEKKALEKLRRRFEQGR
jgi:RNA polymerase sporulation-specific sigma factor